MERSGAKTKAADDCNDRADGGERDFVGVFADDATAAEYGGDCGIRRCLWRNCGDFWGVPAG